VDKYVQAKVIMRENPRVTHLSISYFSKTANEWTTAYIVF